MKSIKLVLKDARLGFPELFHANDPFFKGQGTPNPVYQCRLYLTDEQAEKVRDTLTEVYKLNFPRDWEKRMKKAMDSKNTRGLQQDDRGYYIQAKRKAKDGAPVVIDRMKRPVSEDSGLLYAGCYVNASVNCYNYLFNGSLGASFGLNGIQFSKDGEAFGGVPPASDDDFEDLGEEAMGDEPDPWS